MPDTSKQDKPVIIPVDDLLPVSELRVRKKGAYGPRKNTKDSEWISDGEIFFHHLRVTNEALADSLARRAPRAGMVLRDEEEIATIIAEWEVLADMPGHIMGQQSFEWLTERVVAAGGYWRSGLTPNPDALALVTIWPQKHRLEDPFHIWLDAHKLRLFDELTAYDTVRCAPRLTMPGFAVARDAPAMPVLFYRGGEIIGGIAPRTLDYAIHLKGDVERDATIVLRANTQTGLALQGIE